jgi:LruC domain-containing protein
MKKLCQIFSTLAILLLLISSCQEDPIIVQQEKTMKDIVVPDGFNFDLMQSVPIIVQLPSTISYSSSNRIIEIWSENTDGRPGKKIKTGSADRNGVYQECLAVPFTTKKIFTNCFAGWRSVTLQDAGSKSTDGIFTIDYNVGYGKTRPQLKEGISGSSFNGIKSFQNIPKTGIENMVKNGDFSDKKFGKMDTWSSPIQEDGVWHATDEGKTFGSIISEEGNSFARINSEEYCAGGFTQLIQAKSGQVVTFSGDARGFDSQQDVYLFLIPRNINGEFIDVFSYNMVNPGITWVNGTVAGYMPEGTASCQVLFFKGSTGIVDFDNAIVHVNDTDSDRDSDGVLDWEDSYPDNPNQSFDDYYPAKDKPGTFAFEDTWPATDDFDFNDLILDYQIKRVTNSQNQVVQLDIIYQVRAIGSIIQSGFGLQINITPDLVAGIKTDYLFNDESIRLNGNGTEIGQKWATFILFNNTKSIFPHTQEGSPTVNTTLGYYFVVPTVYIFQIYLKEPVDQQNICNSKINPFIFRSEERSREVHLPGYPPTDLANTDLLGTADDASSAGSGKYYQTKNGIPWAMSLPVQFDYPVESADLLKGHLVFASWISTHGTKYQNWYLDQQNNRDWDFIYRW